MKKLLSLVTVAIACLQALAIPAHPGTTAMPQPDGTMITIELHGDEYYCFTTTADGYTLLQNEQGAYEYARRSGDILVSTGVMAHDAALRTASENALLQGISRRVTDSAAITQSKAMRARRDAAAKVQRYDYSKFRGLIILINYTDVQFSMSDPNSFYDHMINDEGFTGYNDDNGQWVSCTGSVRDYFDNQSSGRFKPHFDVVGPITVNYKSTDHRRTTNSATIFRAALSAANSQVDYSLYDTDNNGVVDMVFFLCAGMSSSFSGNNSQLLWPHRSRISAYYDGKSFGDYACSNELYGWESTPSSIATEGIGTFCHEFSHVLGFPDLYDVDYDGTGGESHHPGSWDIMAGGGSYNYSRTPCGYTIFERFSLGWANPS
ncbi:MAG: M6 family metalloprotease domain-containing protein, partial [Muribaculaceae bacterium]|nr:M6 family metalloprotease domain-containing protein [Muribaculaceae bacterium]